MAFRPCFILFWAILVVGPLSANAASAAITTYEEARARFEASGSLGKDNRTASLVWGRTFYAESLLEAYQATGDETYLDLFVEHVDDIFKLRDDRLNRADYKGRIRPGWSVAAHYTHSAPVVLVDDAGKPALELRATRWMGNQATTADLRRYGDRFTIRARNDFRVPTPIVQEFRQLTIREVEKAVNNRRSKDHLITVRKLGDRPPREALGLRFSPEPMVFHTHHTGAILAPILNFVRLVRLGYLPSRYAHKASEYLAESSASLQDYEADWVDHGDWGYYRIERGSPFWVDGAPEPINAMAEQGRAFLYLWQATGEATALTRVEKILKLILRHTELMPDGAIRWPYWHSEALRGWTAKDDISINTPDFPAYRTIDSTHYAQYTLRFLVECIFAGLDTRPATTDALYATFRRVWRHNKLTSSDRYLAPIMDGRGAEIGRDDVDIFGFMYLARVRRDVGVRLLEMYERKFPPGVTTAVSLYGWSLIASWQAGSYAGAIPKRNRR